MLCSQSCPTCPAVSVQHARSAVSRLTFAPEAGGQPGLGLSAAAAGIAPVLIDQAGAGARSRPARRRPELTARGMAPVRAAASSSSGHGLLCAESPAAPDRRLGVQDRRHLWWRRCAQIVQLGAAPAVPSGHGPWRPGAIASHTLPSRLRSRAIHAATVAGLAPALRAVRYWLGDCLLGLGLGDPGGGDGGSAPASRPARCWRSLRSQFAGFTGRRASG